VEFSLTLLVGAGGTLLGVPWIIGALRDSARFPQKFAAMKQVEGVVTRMRKEEYSASGDGLNATEYSETPMVEYEVNKVRYIIPIRRQAKLGDKFVVAYNPAMPSDATLVEDNSRHAFAAGCVITAVGVALVVLALLGHPVLD